MPIIDLLDLPAAGALLGLDPGTKTLGVAATDMNRLIVSPVETLKRGKTLAPMLEKMFAHYDARKAVAIVLGLPLNFDGSEGPRAQSVRTLARNIMNTRDVPILFQDERLSTEEAKEALHSATPHHRDQSAKIDAVAAAIILKRTLDRLGGPA